MTGLAVVYFFLDFGKMYDDGSLIQVLESRLFMVDENYISSSLDEAEVYLFIKKNNK